MSYVLGGALALATLVVFYVFYVAFRDETDHPPRTKPPGDDG